MAERIHGHLDLLILSVVSTGPKHGYAIISELSKMSGGRFELPEGTVYPALHRLERRGLLESFWAEGHTRRRRVYRLTDDGRSAREQERSAWKDFASGVESVLGWA
ncbi:MAG: helix-turn-helix transcriptional regulator [Acidimicrobiia bacterium]